METLGTVIAAIGLIIAMVGSIWTIVLAFQEELAWGLGCLLCAPAQLVFVFTHWEKAKKAFLINVVGILIWVIGGGVMVASGSGQ